MAFILLGAASNNKVNLRAFDFSIFECLNDSLSLLAPNDLEMIKCLV